MLASPVSSDAKKVGSLVDADCRATQHARAVVPIRGRPANTIISPGLNPPFDDGAQRSFESDTSGAAVLRNPSWKR